MTSIYHLPEQYRATARRIPDALVKASTPAQIVARVIAHDELFKTGLSMSSTVDAGMFFDCGGRVLDGLDEPSHEHLAAAEKAVSPAPTPPAIDFRGTGVVQLGPGSYYRPPPPRINRAAADTPTDMLYKSGGTS